VYALVLGLLSSIMPESTVKVPVSLRKFPIMGLVPTVTGKELVETVLEPVSPVRLKVGVHNQ
jgi:hypothetical protein